VSAEVSVKVLVLVKLLKVVWQEGSTAIQALVSPMKEMVQDRTLLPTGRSTKYSHH